MISFDDLIELRFLPSRRKRKLDPEVIARTIAPRDKCTRYGMINSPWTSHVCRCTGYKFKRMFYGQPVCECGDLFNQHRFKVSP